MCTVSFSAVFCNFAEVFVVEQLSTVVSVFTASLGWWKVVLNQPCIRAASPCWKFSRNRKKMTDYSIENMEIYLRTLEKALTLSFY
jgi:hypothetical protein